jgi:hypothetical protein
MTTEQIQYLLDEGYLNLSEKEFLDTFIICINSVNLIYRPTIKFYDYYLPELVYRFKEGTDHEMKKYATKIEDNVVLKMTTGEHVSILNSQHSEMINLITNKIDYVKTIHSDYFYYDKITDIDNIIIKLIDDGMFFGNIENTMRDMFFFKSEIDSVNLNSDEKHYNNWFYSFINKTEFRQKIFDIACHLKILEFLKSEKTKMIIDVKKTDTDTTPTGANVKLKWLGKPAHLALIIDLLIEKGYIDKQRYSERTASALLNLFEFEYHYPSKESLGRLLHKKEYPINMTDDLKTMFNRMPHRRELP